MNKITKNIHLIGHIFIIFLIGLAFYSSMIIGFSWDEYFHHINGLVRYKFLTSFGDFEKYDFRNNEFYPGLYDTLSYSFGQLFFIISKNFYVDNLAELMHLFNFFFSSLSILGLFLISKKLFNKEIAIFTTLLTLLNPFFFGHMGMNSKDLVVFFSMIWFCYFFYKYVTEEKTFKNLIWLSFFIGFGCGTRLTFLVVIFPVLICGFIYLFKKYESQYFYLTKRFLSHSVVVFLITIFLVIICWPHMIMEIKNGNFSNFFSLIVKNTISWNDGPKIGLINGEYYEVFNTPKTYFLDIVKFRLPFYSSLLIILTYVLVFTKTLIVKNETSNFVKKFYIVNVIAFFPILLAIILGVNIYDNLRLFLFVIPFFSLIAAISLHQLLYNFKDSWKSKIGLITIFTLFIFSFYRFILLTPYQYTYVNHSYPSFKESINKFEHEYWGASYKELVKKIKKNYTQKEIENFKIADCGGGDWTLVYYLKKYLGVKRTYSKGKDLDEATHIVMNNRVFLDVFQNEYVKDLVNDKGEWLIKDMEEVVRAPNIKKRCFDYGRFSGDNEVVVSRDSLALTIFRKVNK